MTYKPKLLQIITEPDPRLHRKSATVEEVTEKIQHLMEDMLFTMYSSEGIGLAAVQAGVHLRVIVMDIDQLHNSDSTAKSRHNPNGKNFHDGKPIYMINPEIVNKSDETTIYCEGCLSFPSITADVTRHTSVTVECLDYYGKKQTHNFEGILSICAQHEIDHTNGVVFLDHLSRLKREYLVKKLLKYKKTLV
jgi:peptide deformylase